jgi:PiT family inorganic phosphate transporter
VLLLVVAVAVLALTFDVSNGFHDSSNSIAALVVTRAARPPAALALAAACHLAGPLVAGTAVADTVGSVVHPPPGQVVAVVGAALTAALVWNVLTWWRALPTSSSHGLVGGLVGASLVATGRHGVNWGGLSGLHPHGVLGVLVGLAISPLLGGLAGAAAVAVLIRALARARAGVAGWVRRAEWVSSGALAFSHGANDAQKTMGVLTLVLLATGHLAAFTVPLWVKLAAAVALTAGTAFGGWRIIRTVGRGIYRLHPLDGLASQLGSAAVILTAARLGAPVSTTHVVAATVVGVGADQRRRHVRWRIVADVASAWLVTLPATAALAAVAYPLWSLSG